MDPENMYKYGGYIGMHHQELMTSSMGRIWKFIKDLSNEEKRVMSNK